MPSQWKKTFAKTIGEEIKNCSDIELEQLVTGLKDLPLPKGTPKQLRKPVRQRVMIMRNVAQHLIDKRVDGITTD